MAEPYAVGLIIFGLAPTAPMLPILIRKARADISLAAAIMPLAVVSTVILMPLMAPLLIPGLTLSSWDIGKPLLLTVLLPLVIGVVIKVYAARVADKIFPVVKKIAGISTLLLLGFTWCSTGGRSSARWAALPSRGQVLFTARHGAVLPLRFRSEPGPAQHHGAGGVLPQWRCHAVAVTAFPVLDPR